MIFIIGKQDYGDFVLEKTFSFVVPVYNTAEKYLKKCIASCIQQEAPQIEVILVDDGSSDECARICDRFAETDKRISVFHQKNAGVAAARNHGIDVAHGDWIICVDSDDWIESTLCEEIRTAEEKYNGIDFLLFSLAKEYREAASQSILGMYENGHMFCSKDDMAQLQRDVLEHPLQNNILVFPYCKAVKRDALLKAQPVFPVGVSMCEDVLSAFKVFGFLTHGVYIDKPLYHYRQLASSAVYKYRKNAEEEQRQLLELLSKMIKGRPNPESYRKGFNREVLYAAQRIFSQKIYHRDSELSWRQKREKCTGLLKKEPFCSAFRDVDLHNLSINHKLKSFLLKYKMYELCSILYRLHYMLPGKKLW